MGKLLGKKVDLKLKKISRISVQSVRKYFRRGSNRFAIPGNEFHF